MMTIVQLFDRLPSGRASAGRGASLFLLMLAFGIALVGCSNPIDRDAGSGAGDGTPAVEPSGTATTTPLMDIVTPTPGSGEPAAPESSEPAGPVEAPDVYVVQEGDTLYAISSQFGLQLSAVVEANNLSDPNDIFVGQELVLPKP